MHALCCHAEDEQVKAEIEQGAPSKTSVWHRSPKWQLGCCHISKSQARDMKKELKRQNYIKASWFSRFMQKIQLAKVWECKYLKWASCESPQLWITPLPQFFNDSNLSILAQVISHTLSAATPRIAQQRQGKAGSGGGGRRLAEHLQISVRALVGGELLWEH